jgi:hypothetical protein
VITECSIVNKILAVDLNQCYFVSEIAVPASEIHDQVKNINDGELAAQ